MNQKNLEANQTTDRAVYQLSVFRSYEYEIISDRIKGKNVLHLGCGEGDGSVIMSGYAAKVVGVDSNEDAMKKAREKNAKENLEFITVNSYDKNSLPFQNSSFDVVVAFQLLERMTDISFFLKEVKRILKNGGTLILSSHNRSIRTFPFQAPWNYGHKKEYDYYELENALARHFEEFRIMDLSFTGMCRRRELGRLTKIKIFLAPFSAVFVPEKIRNRMLEIVWSVFRGDLLFFLGKRNDYAASDREERHVRKNIKIREMSKSKPIYFICFCTNYKKNE